MKLAVMQPYFFPYIGYFQLIKAVDNFVIYDDVNYIKQGWINRNRILINKEPNYITLELLGASSFKKINDIHIGNNKNKILKTIDLHYKKAPNFISTFNLIENILNYKENNLSLFLSNSLKMISTELGIHTNIITSSELSKDNDLKGQEKIIEICKLLGAKTYINAIGGQDLYSREEFSKNNIDLKFIQTNVIEYNQFFSNTFYPHLSIIDVLMHNDILETQKILDNYTLI